MAKLILCFFALVAFAAAAPPKKNTTPAPVEKTQIDQLVEQAGTIVKNVTTTLEGMIPDTKKVTQVIKEQSAVLADNLQKTVQNVNKLLKNDDLQVNRTITQASANLTKVIDDLEKLVGPEATAQGKQVREKLDQTLKVAANELSQIVDAVKPNVENAQQSVSSLVKTILDDFLQTTRTIQTSVNNAIENAAKTK